MMGRRCVEKGYILRNYKKMFFYLFPLVVDICTIEWVIKSYVFHLRTLPLPSCAAICFLSVVVSSLSRLVPANREGLLLF